MARAFIRLLGVHGHTQRKNGKKRSDYERLSEGCKADAGMDLLIKSLSLLDDFLSQKSGALLDKDLPIKDNSQAIFQVLQQLAGYENQLELADCVAKNHKWMETLVSFAVTVFEGKYCPTYNHCTEMSNCVSQKFYRECARRSSGLLSYNSVHVEI